MRNSGCEVPQWMLELHNPSKRAKQKMRNKPVERQAISASNGYPLVSPADAAKLKKKRKKDKSELVYSRFFDPYLI